MNIPPVREAWLPVWHPAFAGAARRGPVVLAAGAAIALGGSRIAAQTGHDGATVPAIVVGSLVAFVGLVDTLAYVRFRISWSRATTGAWHTSPRSTRRTAYMRWWLEHTTPAWNWVIWGAYVSTLVPAVVFVMRAASGSPTGLAQMLPMAGLYLTTAVVIGIRHWLGPVVGEVAFPDTGLRPGADGEIHVIVRTSAARLEAARASFELRCVRALPPVLGVFPRSEIVTVIEPAVEPVRPSTQVERSFVRWKLRFRIREDAPPADLLAARPVHWELIVEALGERSAWRERFIVPVLGATAPLSP